MFEERLARTFGNEKEVFTMAVASEPVNTVQGKGTGVLVRYALQAVVHNLSPTAVKAKFWKFAIDYQRPKLLFYFR
jgi:hypothetical protein